MTASPIPPPSLDRVRAAVRQHAAGRGVVRAIVFGSLARGETAEDVDLCLIQHTDRPFFDRVRDFLDLVWELAPCDLLVYTPAEWQTLVERGSAFAEAIAREGIDLDVRPA